MNWRERLFGRDVFTLTEAAPVVYAPKPALVMPKLGTLRKGMWVMTPEGVGIVASFASNAEAEVHLTDALGGTKESKTFFAGQITQAGVNDIPEARRPDAAVAARMGYL